MARKTLSVIRSTLSFLSPATDLVVSQLLKKGVHKRRNCFNFKSIYK